MVKFINSQTGSVMWIAEERIDEYKAAGHKPAADAIPEKPKKEPAAKKPKKK